MCVTGGHGVVTGISALFLGEPWHVSGPRDGFSFPQDFSSIKH